MEELYALALTLVPDPDIAGDLFLAASDEDDLRIRAQRWREQNGCGPLPDRLIIPPLTADQREHALHLINRRRRRKRALLGLVASGLAVGALALGLLLLRNTGGYTLAGDAAFTGKSIAVTDEEAGLQLSIYQVQSTPGQITVWWAISGRDAAARVGDLQPELMTPSGSPYEAWVKANDIVTYAHRKDRVLGRSTFLKFASDRSSRVFLRMLEGGQEKEGWNLSVPIRRLADHPDARTVQVGTAGITSFSTGPGYTAVRIQGSSRGPAPAVVLETDKSVLNALGTWRASDRAPIEQQIVFPPLPEGTRQVNLAVYTSRGTSSMLTFQLYQNQSIGGVQVSGWKHVSNRLEVIATVGDDLVFQIAQLRDGTGSVFPLPLDHEYLGRDANGARRWRIYHDDLRNPLLTMGLQVIVTSFPSPPVIIPVEVP